MKPTGMWFPIGLCCLFTILAILVTIIGSSISNIIIMWSLVLVSVIVVVVYIWQINKIPVKFTISDPSISICWYDEAYAVSKYDVIKETARVVNAFASMYTRESVINALNGCHVFIREPKWSNNGRTVAGLQYGATIEIGWYKLFETSAYAHELGHRVLEVCGGDPEENAAHVVLSKIGL